MRVTPPHRMQPTECCFPHCESALSAKVDLPLCDWHLVKTYREVHALTQEPLVRLKAVTQIVDDRPAPRESVVYFLQFADRVKIGHSSNLPERLKVLPYDHILATVPGGRSEEERLHRRFKHLRVTGEWFRMGDDLMEYIAAAPSV